MDTPTIETSEQLSQYIKKLREELLTSPEKWENVSLETFLEALSAWIIDMEGFYVRRGINLRELLT